MRRMLDPTKVGGIPSTIEFDKDGNRTADKDLKVNGKLKLQSLVSNTNPDGDITKELGSSARHCYTMIISNRIHYQVYTTKNYDFEINNIKELPTNYLSKPEYNELHADGKYPVSGYWYDTPHTYTMIANILNISGAFNFLEGYDIVSNNYKQNVQVGIDNARVIKQY